MAQTNTNTKPAQGNTTPNQSPKRYQGKQDHSEQQTALVTEEEKRQQVKDTFDERQDEIKAIEERLANVEKEIAVLKTHVNSDRKEQAVHERNASSKKLGLKEISAENDAAAVCETWGQEDKTTLEALMEMSTCLKQILNEMHAISIGDRDERNKKITKDAEKDHPIRTFLFKTLKFPFNVLSSIYHTLKRIWDGPEYSIGTVQRDMIKFDTENRAARANSEKISEDTQDIAAEIVDRGRENTPEEERLTVPEQTMSLAALCTEKQEGIRVNLTDKDGHEQHLLFSYNSAYRTVTIKDADKNIPLINIETADENHKVPNSRNIIKTELNGQTFFMTRSELKNLQDLTNGKTFTVAPEEQLTVYENQQEEEEQKSGKDQTPAEVVGQNTSAETKDDAARTANGEPMIGTQGQTLDQGPKEDREAKPTTDDKTPDIGKDTKIAEDNKKKEAEAEYAITTIKFRDGKTIDLPIEKKYIKETERAAHEAFQNAVVKTRNTNDIDKSKLIAPAKAPEYLNKVGIKNRSMRDTVRDVIQNEAPDAELGGRNFWTAKEAALAIIAECERNAEATENKEIREAYKEAAKAALNTAYKATHNNTLSDNKQRANFMASMAEMSKDPKIGEAVSNAILCVTEEQTDFSTKQIAAIFRNAERQKEDITRDGKRMDKILSNTAKVIEANSLADKVTGYTPNPFENGSCFVNLKDITNNSLAMAETENGYLYNTRSNSILIHGDGQPWTMDDLTDQNAALQYWDDRYQTEDQTRQTYLEETKDQTVEMTPSLSSRDEQQAADDYEEH